MKLISDFLEYVVQGAIKLVRILIMVGLLMAYGVGQIALIGLFGTGEAVMPLSSSNNHEHWNWASVQNIALFLSILLSFIPAFIVNSFMLRSPYRKHFVDPQSFEGKDRKSGYYMFWFFWFSAWLISFGVYITTLEIG